MQAFLELCQRVRFPGDEPLESDASGEAHHVAEYAARMRSNALRVTETLTPTLHRCVTNVTERLALEEIPECFVVADPQANASAPLFGRQHRALVILNSGLVELLSPVELEFVLGHELGHLGCGHGSDIGRQPAESEYETLQRYSESRSREISADRVGLLAVRSLFAAAGVMVKLASGLNSQHVKLDIGAFLDQLRRDPEEISREWELHYSHPSLPLRLLSLVKFSETKEYLACSETGGTGRPLAEVDREIASLLEQLGDGRLPELHRERFDRTVAWAGAALVMEDNAIGAHERSELERLIGSDLTDKVLAFAEHSGWEEVNSKLQGSLSALQSAGPTPVNRFLSTFRSFAQALGIEPEQARSWPTIVHELKLDAPARSGVTGITIDLSGTQGPV